MSKKFNYRDMADYLPLRDLAVCEKVRAIRKADVCRHPRKNVKIRIIEDDATFGFAFVLDIVRRIKQSADEGKKQYVMILPAPNPG